MSKPTLYYVLESTPCRTVIAVGQILKIDFELKHVDFMKQEHKTPEYLKLNPFHQIPTFVDHDGFVLAESRAIATYLFESRQPDQQQFYPKNNLKRRAQIDRWLYYDCGTFVSIRKPLYQLYHHGKLDETMIKNGKETLQTFNDVLGSPSVGHGNFLVDNQISLADISMYFNADIFEYTNVYNFDDYPHIKAWYHKVGEELKKYDHEGLFPKAIESMKKMIENFNNKKQ